jgi:hypothetical protein
MKRRLILSVAAGALVAASVPAAASAGAAIGGCPTGADWQLVYPIHQPQAADKNGDGWLCRLLLNAPAPQGGRIGGDFTFFDNDVR